jgi:hypothetical protein
MFIPKQTSQNNNNNYIYSKKEIKEMTWLTKGVEILYPKDKFYFSNEEKTIIKKYLLSKSPPSLDIRRQVKF